MSRHKGEDKEADSELETWERAAKAEGCTLSEFKRRAINERAYHVLNPGTRLLHGIFEGVARIVEKKPVLELEKFCMCGHSIAHHPAVSGTDLHGSCGVPTCNCTKFQERKILGRKEERKA